jgi:hypothetical protein
LLRILEEFALPEDGSQGGQVIYVTHSPYLINRNAAQRIRVLDKGSHDEGTRVVTDVARNHYEPLRSSLGPFVAETAFIGGSNLFVEGLADQVLLAGVSSHLRSLGTTGPSRSLNLNEVTIVPAGSAGAIPYLVYLARGRDEVKPPCVVLLDGDASGKEAARRLNRNPAGRRAFMSPAFIVMVDEWVNAAPGIVVDDGVTVEEPEDLIALPVAAAAARKFAESVLGVAADLSGSLTDGVLREHLPPTRSVWDAVEGAFTAVFPDEHIQKVGFAREVVGVLQRTDDSTDEPLRKGADETRRNFAQLLGHLADLLRDARAEEDDAQQRDRVGRLVRGFLLDHPEGVKRDVARLLFREIGKALEDTDEGDARRTQLASMRRTYLLDEEPLEQVPNYRQFRDELRGLPLQQRLASQQRPEELQPRDFSTRPKSDAPAPEEEAQAPVDEGPALEAAAGTTGAEPTPGAGKAARSQTPGAVPA